jgi:hypothetical protein
MKVYVQMHEAFDTDLSEEDARALWEEASTLDPVIPQQEAFMRLAAASDKS